MAIDLTTGTLVLDEPALSIDASFARRRFERSLLHERLKKELIDPPRNEVISICGPVWMNSTELSLELFYEGQALKFVSINIYKYLRFELSWDDSHYKEQRYDIEAFVANNYASAIPLVSLYERRSKHQFAWGSVYHYDVQSQPAFGAGIILEFAPYFHNKLWGYAEGPRKR